MRLVDLTKPRLMMLAAGLLVVAAGVAGCGGDDDDDTADDTTPRATNTISGGDATTEPEDTEEPEETATTETEATKPAGGGAVELELVADGLKFDKDELTVPAGSDVTLTLENKEAVPHDFAIYETEAAEEEIFKGDLVTDDTIVYEFEAPTDPGTYFFRCNIHPTDMTGDFIVE